MIERLTKLLREPLVHFLLISVGIYGLYAGLTRGTDGVDERTITVSAAEVSALRDHWMRIWQRPPTEEELAEIIRGSVRTQVLYREAVAMGLEQGDTVVERRLAQRLEALAKNLMMPEEPTEDQLRAWFEEHVDKFREPDRYSIVQVYFNPDRRNASTLQDARAALDELRSKDGIPADIESYGDRLMLRNHYVDQTELDLRNAFGSKFVEHVSKLEPGLWHGPVPSGYGTHLVYVAAVKRAAEPDYTAFAEQAREGWTADRVEELREQFVENLIAKYEITIEAPAGVLAIPES